MLHLSLKRVTRLRGIEKQNRFLIDLGFAPATARNLLKKVVRRMDSANLEKLCIALNCTPNDLLQRIPPDNQANPEAQALIKLTRQKEDGLSNPLKVLPIEMFERIAGILRGGNDKRAAPVCYNFKRYGSDYY